MEGTDNDIGKDRGDTEVEEEDEEEASKPNDSPTGDEVSKFALTLMMCSHQTQMDLFARVD